MSSDRLAVLILVLVNIIQMTRTLLYMLFNLLQHDRIENAVYKMRGFMNRDIQKNSEALLSMMGTSGKYISTLIYFIKCNVINTTFSNAQKHASYRK